MWTILFSILLLMVFGKILLFAVKAAWGVSKIVVSLVVAPIFLVVLVFVGLLQIAFPILLIIGLITLFTLRD